MSSFAGEALAAAAEGRDVDAEAEGAQQGSGGVVDAVRMQYQPQETKISTVGQKSWLFEDPDILSPVKTFESSKKKQKKQKQTEATVEETTAG